MASSALAAPRRPGLPAPGAPELAPLELLPILLREARSRIVPLAGIFTAIALLTLVVGLFVIPRNYTASVTILAQDSDIIQPLLEGRAVPTGVADRAGMARQIIYGRKVLSEALAVGGWLDGTPSPVEQDRLMEEIRNRTMIDSPRPDLVQISYRDRDPERAYRITEAFGDMFMREAAAAKERESREAYEFIDSQVQEYHAKLSSAEANLQDYQSRNVDAQPGSAADATTRIGALRTQVEQTRMALLEQESRESSIAAQLSGESAVTAVQTREGLYRTRLIELQAERDRLLLAYTEQHPDVVRLRHQIDDINRMLADERDRREVAAPGALSDEAQANPLYQELRSQLAQARRESAATRSRLQVAQSLLDDELDRSRRIAASEGALAELTRDYEVNREIYQDLLRRRENARVSMGLDQENRGLTLRVQDPATMPLRPSGLRFMHIAAAGLLVAVAIPLALVFAVARFDPRIRSPHLLVKHSGLPLLTTVPAYPTPRERRREYASMALAVAMVASVVLVYGLTYAYRIVAA
ncbi:chain-length determining protein [Luteimonas padinae]|uniref:XrtA system polysaccharide chain length determinant n=1 Tax=Luteimonas padinae TaxID=1714359 RepID=A0ABV6SXG3_9GAMM|nr:XrtA system polysaccharide chain length determinant [Luteimonas padinae]GHD65423.1 chain-length determining protein [Luteimonas padinae]